MSTGSSKLKKGSRVSGLQLPPNRYAVVLESLKRAEVLTRIGMCVLAAVLMWLLTLGWQPPFSFREGDVPNRAIATRVAFQTLNQEKTMQARLRARKQVVTTYRQDREPTEQLRKQLIDKVRQIIDADSPSQLEKPSVWQDFLHGISPTEGDTQQGLLAADQFTAFKAQFVEPKDLEAYENKVEIAMKDIDEFGLLANLQHDYDKDGGIQEIIRVGHVGSTTTREVNVRDVLIQNALEKLKTNLEKSLDNDIQATHTAAWFRVKGRLQPTLTWDQDATQKAADAASDEVKIEYNEYVEGDILAHGSKPLQREQIELLRAEHRTASQQLSIARKLSHTVANFGMYAAVFLLCGSYSVFRRNKVLTNTESLFRILCLAFVTLAICWFASGDFPQTVLVALLLFSMTVVIAHEQELALLLSTVMAMIVVVALGFGLQEFVIYVASMATAILCLRDVRNRSKLIYVGLATAVVAVATAVGSSTLMDPTSGIATWMTAAWYGFFAVVAGLLMTGMLPFIENLFDIQTDLSLLELGDVSHPLLQELVRRAPGTYNHTINVASMAEAAAEAIDANGLLVRVGAYFHDIGKMLKPGYFIENQGDGHNRHESLLPAMSTLVIIAHVKDGADLARQHNLPNALIDFIMQHHGTTLVEYFYNRANEQSESDPDSGEVDEHSYRYPGPKPQTKEAAVLMLSDTVESAGRSLTDPTPSRIENLVHELAMKKLLDGQFDECGLTLSELKRIEVSLIKSLSAVYHARIKYTDQQQSA